MTRLLLVALNEGGDFASWAQWQIRSFDEHGSRTHALMHTSFSQFFSELRITDNSGRVHTPEKWLEFYKWYLEQIDNRLVLK